jgi:type IV pilus assembly protein PilO
MAFSPEMIKKLPTQYKALILLGTLALMGAGYYFGVYTGKQDELTKITKELTAQTKELQKLEDTKKNLVAYKAKVSELEAELTLLLVQIPKSSEIPGILSNVSTKGRESGLTFLLFQPDKETKSKDKKYTEVPVSIRVEGTYQSFAVFLDKVRKLERIINVREITMKKKAVRESNIILDISCKAVTFKFAE